MASHIERRKFATRDATPRVRTYGSAAKAEGAEMGSHAVIGGTLILSSVVRLLFF
jgi:hypothetical protein